MGFTGGQGVQFSEISQIFDCGQPPIQPVSPAKGETDVLPYIPGVLQNVLTENMNAAAGGNEQSGEHFYRGGLAGAVWTEQTEEFSFVHMEGDTAHRLGRARGACEEAMFGVKGLHQRVGFNGAIICRCQHGVYPVVSNQD